MGRLFRQPKIRHLMSSPPPTPPQKKRGEKGGKLKDKRLDTESYCRPRHKAGQEKLVYRLIVNSSPPRKSLVEGERFVRDEGDPELLRVV